VWGGSSLGSQHIQNAVNPLAGGGGEYSNNYGNIYHVAHVQIQRKRRQKDKNARANKRQNHKEGGAEFGSMETSQ